MRATSGGLAAVCILAAPAWMPGAARGQCTSGWKPGQALPGLDGKVNAMTVWDDGGGPALYVGGEFSIAGEAMAVNIARWHPDTGWSALGSGLTASSPGSTGGVHALTVYNDELIAGG